MPIKVLSCRAATVLAGAALVSVIGSAVLSVLWHRHRTQADLYSVAPGGLLPAGSPAPDFTLASAGGGTIQLAQLKGKIVWLYAWKSG